MEGVTGKVKSFESYLKDLLQESDQMAVRLYDYVGRYSIFDVETPVRGGDESEISRILTQITLEALASNKYRRINLGITAWIAVVSSSTEILRDIWRILGLEDELVLLDEISKVVSPSRSRSPTSVVAKVLRVDTRIASRRFLDKIEYLLKELIETHNSSNGL